MTVRVESNSGDVLNVNVKAEYTIFLVNSVCFRNVRILMKTWTILIEKLHKEFLFIQIIIPDRWKSVCGKMNGQIILATGGYDHTIKLWRAETKDCIKSMQHADSVNILLFELTGA